MFYNNIYVCVKLHDFFLWATVLSYKGTAQVYMLKEVSKNQKI